MKPNSIRIWLTAARPRTLAAAAAPVLVGVSYTHFTGEFRLGPALAAALGAIWIQIGTNLANDLGDATRGADENRVGPLRVTQAGWVTPQGMKIATAIAFSMATLFGIYLTWVAGWPVIAIGVLSILSGILYTAGPRPLGYLGLGDLFVWIFFGPVAVVGTYFVQSLKWSWPAFWLSIPIGALSVALLAANNLRDEVSDRKAGKGTLVVRWGAKFGKFEYVICTLFLPVAGVFYVYYLTRSVWALLAAVAPVFAWIRPIRSLMRAPDSQAHVGILHQTALCLVLYAATLSIPLILF